MSKINPDNTLTFVSSQPLFDRVKARLSSFDALGLLDDQDFYDDVVYVLNQLGCAAFKEKEAFLKIEDHKAHFPAGGLKLLHAAYKCHGTYTNIPSINEQGHPYVYYTEIHQDCSNGCCAECHNDNEGRTKIVVRNFVQGENHECSFSHFHLLRPSSNVKKHFTEDSPNFFHNHGYHSSDEIELDYDAKVIHTHFKEGHIYLQYYALPMDENELPMIPDDSSIAEAIYYRICSQVFESMFWNSTIPNIVMILKDSRDQYDFYFKQARYEARLPSFAKMTDSIRRSRSRRKFMYSPFDKTISRPYYGFGVGYDTRYGFR